MEILKIEDLTFAYPLCESPAVQNVTLDIDEGEFVVLCGATGSGKSTFLRLLKPELSSPGEKSGIIYYKGTPISENHNKETAGGIGYVMQKPEQQIVTDKVWHELAFGLENLGTPQTVIARRVAEIASYFGIEAWYDKHVSELSGGQKQLLTLASVMIMNPDVLLLDEPTAQLDPIAANDFITTLKKLNTDFSLTVIITEHRLEELIPLCDRLVVMEHGKIMANGNARTVAMKLQNTDMMDAMPASTRLYRALSASGECPLTVKEGRQFIEQNYKNKIRALTEQNDTHSEKKALEFHDVYFSYGRNLPDVLQGVNLTVYEHEIFCILGGNGSGKTTLLGTAAGLRHIYSGTIRVLGKKLKDYKNQSLYRECLSLLPQDVETVFLKNTVREELAEVGADKLSLPFDISHLYEKHPYDLSGGEQQLVALAKVLATKPKVLLMDEPTKGLDASKKKSIIEILKKLKANGVTIVIVTHDVEFAADCADRCALFFRGQAVSVGKPSDFFSENRFYTTAVSRMSRGYYDNCVTIEQLTALARLNAEEKPC